MFPQHLRRNQINRPTVQFRFLTLSLPTIFLLLSSTPCFTCQQVDTTTRATGRATDREILNVFPDSTVSAQNKFETTIQSKYSPSSSIWAEGLNEEAVFQAELTHREDETNSFSLRMGRGGQIYSLRGPFGESVPPSWRAEAQDRSPWNDEVWQFVAVCKRYNDLRNLRAGKNKSEEAIKQFTELPYANLYFVHNSGAYIPQQHRDQLSLLPAARGQPNQRRLPDAQLGTGTSNQNDPSIAHFVLYKRSRRRQRHNRNDLGCSQFQRT